MDVPAAAQGVTSTSGVQLTQTKPAEKLPIDQSTRQVLPTAGENVVQIALLNNTAFSSHTHPIL
jgi:hypothetical protein